eukprot:1676994-Pyramimonas_sp.AAC.1
MDLKGHIVDLKGYNVDLKGYIVDLKGYNVDLKGTMWILWATVRTYGVRNESAGEWNFRVTRCPSGEKREKTGEA